MDWQPHADATTAVFIFFPTSEKWGGGGQGWGRGKGGVIFQGGSPQPVFDCLCDTFAKTPLGENQAGCGGME